MNFEDFCKNEDNIKRAKTMETKLDLNYNDLLRRIIILEEKINE